MSIEQVLAKLDTGAAERTAAALKDRRQGPLRRPRGRRRARRRRRRGLRRPQGHPHRRAGRALRRPGARHHGHRELHRPSTHTEGPKLVTALEAARPRATTSTSWTSQTREVRLRPATDEPGGLAPRRAGQRRHPASAAAPSCSAPVPALALHDRRARRGRSTGTSGVTYCPHCDGPALQGQARRRHRRRQLRRRGRHRPRRRGGPRHPARVRRHSSGPTRCSSASCYSLPNVERASSAPSPPRSLGDGSKTVTGAGATPTAAPRTTVTRARPRAGDLRADRPAAPTPTGSLDTVRAQPRAARS